jgi:hypothetical protein
MTATLDRSPPPWAATIWHDGQALYLRLPDSGHICRLLYTEAGLSKALKLIRANARTPQRTVLAPATIVRQRRTKGPKEHIEGSLSDLLKKAGN